MISQLSHVMLWSTNLEDTIKWYTEKLEFIVDYYAPNEFATMHHPAMGRLDFHGTKDQKQVGHGPYPYYTVEDIDAAVAWRQVKALKSKNLSRSVTARDTPRSGTAKEIRLVWKRFRRERYEASRGDPQRPPSADWG